MTMESETAKRVMCPYCGNQGKRVSPVTLRALLKEPFVEGIAALGRSCCGSTEPSGCRPTTADTGWRFCDTQDCDTVYFAEEGDARFTRSQLKVAVGVKETAGERPLCYCFGHSIASIKHELRTKGRSDALDDIRAKMKDPGCRCETKNPSGACCLGSVTKGVQIARQELRISNVDVKAPAMLSKPSIPSTPSSSRGEQIAKIGTVVSALVASSCCWLPLLLLAVGISGAGIATTMEAYRPIFVVVTFGLLAAAFYFTYLPRKAIGAAEHSCCASELIAGAPATADCRAPTGTRRFSMMAMSKIMLWVVTVLAVVFLLFPQYVGFLLGTAGGDSATVTADMHQAIVRIDGMTCEGCATTVARAIRKVPSVLAVEVSYEKKQAVVGTEICCPMPKEKILAALKNAGYAGEIIESRKISNDRAGGGSESDSPEANTPSPSSKSPDVAPETDGSGEARSERNPPNDKVRQVTVAVSGMT